MFKNVLDTLSMLYTLPTFEPLFEITDLATSREHREQFD